VAIGCGVFVFCAVAEHGVHHARLPRMAGTITCRYTVSVTWVDLWPTVSQMSCSGTPLLLMIDTGGVPSLLGVLIACPLRGTWWGRVARHAGTCDRLAGGKGQHGAADTCGRREGRKNGQPPVRAVLMVPRPPSGRLPAG